MIPRVEFYQLWIIQVFQTHILHSILMYSSPPTLFVHFCVSASKHELSICECLSFLFSPSHYQISQSFILPRIAKSECYKWNMLKYFKSDLKTSFHCLYGFLFISESNIPDYFLLFWRLSANSFFQGKEDGSNIFYTGYKDFFIVVIVLKSELQ